MWRWMTSVQRHHSREINSYTSVPVRRDLDRKFVETFVPFKTCNSGPGFMQYELVQHEVSRESDRIAFSPTEGD